MNSTIKHADPDHAIHELIAKRWSPYGFADKAVSKEDLCSLFEAARWAASSYNEQPWSYIVATKDQAEEHERIVSCLVEANQEWAKMAPVLALAATRLVFSRNGKPNAAAIHDLGIASATLTFEATSRGLYVHQMIGINPDRAREIYQVPEEVQVLTALAIGYAADPKSLLEKFQERDQNARPRKPLEEFVFAGKWEQTAEFV